MIEFIVDLLVSIVAYPIEMLISILGLKYAIMICAFFITVLSVKGITSLTNIN